MTLYLLPNLLSHEQNVQDSLPASVFAIVKELDGLIAESEGEGRRFLKRFQTKKPPYQMPIATLSENTNFLLEPVLKGEKWGVVSDAGLPCLADPGALLVKRARRLGITVEAFSGPSSISLALMLSGLSGQQFFFHGYIPKTPEERKKALLLWQQMRQVTHIFIEAPYRNLHTFQAVLDTLEDSVEFCVAINLTGKEQFVQTLPIKNWKLSAANMASLLYKNPAIFLFSS